MISTSQILKTFPASSSRTSLLAARVAGIRLVRPRRYYASGATTNQSDSGGQGKQEASLWVDSISPVSWGRLDPSYYIGYAFEDKLLQRLRSIFSQVHTHGFQLVSLEPHIKDGGVFVNFKYDPVQDENTLEKIVQDVRESVVTQGGVPSWLATNDGDVWLVKGKPWLEDMNRFPSSILRISFDGPDLSEETLYRLLRPYGKIHDIVPPSPVPAGTLRSVMVSFRRARSAACARNTIHGLQVPSSSSALTTLRASYVQPLPAHVIRDYITGHPRIFLPVLFFLIGTVTYAVFDPIRVLMVEGKMNDWFDIQEFAVYKWLRANTVGRFSFTTSPSEPALFAEAGGLWKERQDAEEGLRKYLADYPSTITFVYGPQGSGKTRMLNAVLKDIGRKAMVIDVSELTKATSDTVLVSKLASQTGYWPVFSFLNSVNNMIDLASVGLIGQKAGLSSSLPDQLKQILEVVGRGLARGNASHPQQSRREGRARTQQRATEVKTDEKEVEKAMTQKIQDGFWSGVSAVSSTVEPLFGKSGSKPTEQQDHTEGQVTYEKAQSDETKQAEDASQPQQQSDNDSLPAVDSMPVVIIKNFETKGGGARKEELLDVLSQWAASLAENQIAHIIVVSDNRENVKRLAKALPSKPLNQISLSDADNASAMSFVTQKLHDSGLDVQFSSTQTSYIERLGGRASDLESLVHKMRSGMSVEEAVDDIIIRDVVELRKNAFGDDSEDAKNLPWTREQAWKLIKLLSKKPEVSYHEILMDFPFKVDEEAPLRHMEHAELITIGTHNGRPSTIKPGKPVYKWVFERLVDDPIFQATQDIAFNKKVIASAEATIKDCEDELVRLKEVDAISSRLWSKPRVVETRTLYLLRKMRDAEAKIDSLEAQNSVLKKTLSKAARS